MKRTFHWRRRRVWAYIMLFTLTISVSMPRQSYGADRETLSGKEELQESEQLPESMSLFSDELTLKLSEDIGIIKPVFSPAGTGTTAIFQSEDEKIARVEEDGSVIPVSLGHTYIYVTTPEGLTACCDVTIIESDEDFDESGQKGSVNGLSGKTTSENQASEENGNKNVNRNIDENTTDQSELKADEALSEDIDEKSKNMDSSQNAEKETAEQQSSEKETLNRQKPESESEIKKVREYLQLSRERGFAAVSESAGLSPLSKEAEGGENKAADDTSDKSKESTAVSDILNPDIDTVISAVRSYMLTNDTNPDYSSIWNVIGMTRSGLEVPETYINTFYSNVYSYLEGKNWEITKTKYSDYSKLIIGLTAIGIDAQNVGGHNLLANLSDFTKVNLQGFNGPIWALIALKSHPSYTIPVDSNAKQQTTEEGLIQYILKGETPSGGWSLAGSVPDADITGMTIQALSSYYGVRDDVTQAIDRALSWLSSSQLPSGGYGTMGAETSESVAQIIVALSSLSIDGGKDARFIKSGKWPMTGLFQYYMPEGGFMHVAEGAANNGGGEAGKLNGMATEQGMYATVAYKRLLEGKTALYNMSDITLKKGEKPASLPSGSGQTDNSASSTKKTDTTTVSKKVNVIKVALNYSQITVTKGKSKTLKATVTPSNATNKKLKWTTSNKKIATVTSKGKVTGKKAGTAKITVTAADGSKKKAVCTVKVKAAATTSRSKTTVATTRSQTKTIATTASRPAGTTVSKTVTNTSAGTTVKTTGTGANGQGAAVGKTEGAEETSTTEEAGWSFDGADYVPEIQEEAEPEENTEASQTSSEYEENLRAIPYVMMGGGGCGIIWAIWWILRRKKVEAAEQAILKKARQQEDWTEDKWRY